MSSNNYHKARKRVRGKKGFYYHLAVYLSVSLFLIAINLLTSPWDPWASYPILGWGLVLFFHYLGAIGIPFLNLDKNWEEREIEREVQKMERKKSLSAPDQEDHLQLDEKLELKEFKKLREEWDDQEFV